MSSFKEHLAFFQSQVAQNAPQHPSVIQEHKETRPIMPAIRQGPRAPNMRAFEHSKPQIIVPKQGQGPSATMAKTKLAPLNSQLPQISSSGSANAENVPPVSESNHKMSFKDKVGMLASLKSGPMAVTDYKVKKPTGPLEPMSPRPYEPLPDLGTKKPEGGPEMHIPSPPKITAARKGIRRPTGMPPVIKQPHA